MPFPNGKSNILIEQPIYYGMIKSLELNNIPVLGINRGFNGLDLYELEKLFKYGDINFFTLYLDFIIRLAPHIVNLKNKKLLKLINMTYTLLKMILLLI